MLEYFLIAALIVVALLVNGFIHWVAPYDEFSIRKSKISRRIEVAFFKQRLFIYY